MKVINLKAEEISALAAMISAVFAIISTVITFLNVYFSRKEKKDSIKKEQARKISVWIDDYVNEEERKIIINNISNMPIYDVVLIGSIYNESEEYIKNNINPFKHKVIQCIPPGKYYCTMELSGGMCKYFGVEIAFRDSSEICWHIDKRGILKNIDRDYLNNIYKVDFPISWDYVLKEYRKIYIKS